MKRIYNFIKITLDQTQPGGKIFFTSTICSGFIYKTFFQEIVFQTVNKLGEINAQSCAVRV